MKFIENRMVVGGEKEIGTHCLIGTMFQFENMGKKNTNDISEFIKVAY